MAREISEDETKLPQWMTDLVMDPGRPAQEYINMLPLVYEKLNEVIGTYMDMEEDDRHILALWICAAPYKEAFEAFPILFINASKSSGKTRLLKLISAIIPESVLASSMSESSLFRLSAAQRCILIDEAEHLNSKEKTALNDLLNSCYKKGGEVMRVEKDSKGALDVKRFPVYNPVVLANIWGLGNVLEDRCIKIVLEKTNNQNIITMPEMFGKDPRIRVIRAFFSASSASVGAFGEEEVVEAIYKELLHIYNIHTYTLPSQQALPSSINSFIAEVQELQLDGRDMELWMPLFVVSWLMNGGGTYTEALALAKQRCGSKQADDTETDRDTMVAISLYGYLAQLTDPVLYNKTFIQQNQPDDGAEHPWLTPEWLAKFLKRTGIVKSKRRLGKGNEYTVNLPKLKRYLQVRNALDQVDTVPDTTPRAHQGLLGKDNVEKAHLPPPLIKQDTWKKVDIGQGKEVICPVCKRGTYEIWEYGKFWGCAACKQAKEDDQGA